MTFQLKFFLFLSITFVTNGFAFNNFEQQKPVDSAAYYYHKIIKPDSKADLVKAFVYYQNKKDENIKQKDTLNTIYSLRQIAIIQNKLGILYDSETTAIEALFLAERLPLNQTSKESRVGIYNHLGRVYNEMQDYDNAIIYYQKALALAETQQQQLVLRNNIAYAQLKRHKFLLAQQEFEAIYKESKALNDSVNMARTLNNLGIVKGELQDKEAMIDFKEALNIRLALGNNSDILGSYYDLSEYYKKEGDLIQAAYYAKEAYRLAKISENPNHLTHALSLLMSLKDDPDVILYDRMMDSIQTVNLLVEGKYASKKYALAKQEALANERLLELEKEKNLKYLYAFLALIVLGIGIVILFFQKHHHKKQKQLEIYNTELRISKKVHDEVANDVYHIMNKLQHNDGDKHLILDHLEIVYNKTRDISREHQEINVTEDFKSILSDLIIYYKNNEVNILTKDISKIEWSTLKAHKKVAVYRVLQELLTNMKKHSQASLVVLNFKQNSHSIFIDYKDNGVGCNLKIQNGLQNAENRMHTINGSITFQSELKQGFHAVITV
ncbi:tetratricopeptide repeat-containing sensor histidine kinase [Bizionia arctica]|uniref:Tetratricopeptide repeat protein n=1 Tax=Bizionia arctica TaxID=1495645 RepID=A0A917GPJ4_9FLAO|nr:tetratricopeptide repeat-containing sensor histidine kinase [Bizionia arctica]GGG52775.1 hypothetical protein GCM10010976_24840 [Bizionia arctica]